MTKEQIFKEADKRYPIPENSSDSQERDVRLKRRAFIEGALWMQSQSGEQKWTDEGMEILKRLVELKDMKDEGFNNKQEVNEYNREKDKAWSDARNYIKSLKQ